MLDVVEVCWAPPDLPLGQLLEDRYYVLENLEINNYWLCWDLQEQREVKVKAIEKPQAFEMNLEMNVCLENSDNKLDDNLRNQQEKYEIPENAIEKSEDFETYLVIYDSLGCLNTNLGELLQERFYVLKLISDGQMMTLLLCWDLQEKRDVVIKILKEDKDDVKMVDNENQMLLEAPDAHSSLLCWDLQEKRDVANKILKEDKDDVKMVDNENQMLLEAPDTHSSDSVMKLDFASNAIEYPDATPIKLEHHDGTEILYINLYDNSMIEQEKRQVAVEEPDDSEIHVSESLAKLNTNLGELLHERYFVLARLCKGNMSTILLCWDLKVQREVVLKIPAKQIDDVYMVANEIEMLRAAHKCYPTDPRRERIVQILEDFSLYFTECKVPCAVLEVLEGTVLHLIDDSTNHSLPLAMVKNISRQLLEGLDYLHCCQIIHTDIKPENILYLSGKDYLMDVHIKIADLGNACFVHNHISCEIQTPPYRSVEAILDADYDTSADIWSAACVIYELATGDPLFQINNNDDMIRNMLHLAAIIEHLRPIPMKLIARGRKSCNMFDQHGQLLYMDNIHHNSLRNVLLDRYSWSLADAVPFASFLEYMLELEPANRPTAAECLRHPWLK
ncbi:hypothetical protein ACLKA6_012969 [Drosophila palustris]